MANNGISRFTDADLEQTHVLSYSNDAMVLIEGINELPEDNSKFLDNVIIILVYEGSFQLAYDGKREEMHSGDVFIGLPGKVVSDYMMSRDLDFRIICIRQKPFAHIMYASKTVWTDLIYIKDNPVISVGTEKMENLKMYYTLLKDKIPQAGTPFYKDTIEGLFSAFTFEVLGILESHHHSVKQMSREIHHGDLLYKEFTDLLAESGGRIHSVNDMADQLHVTAKYLSAVVRKSSGRKAYDIIRDSITQAIEQRLRYTDKSVKAIAWELGFDNLSFFGRFCRNNLGCSPNEYRRRMKGK